MAELAEGPRYVLSFLVPLCLVLAATPYVREFAIKKGIVARPTSDRFHSQPIAYLGGAVVGAAFLVVALFVAGPSEELRTVLVAAAAVCAMGLLDDRRTVGPLVKIGVEVGAAIALWIVGLRLEVFDLYALDLIVTIGWVVLITNAQNLIDNMDGLAAGLAVISGLTFFVMAAHQGDHQVASVSIALAGASLGFLRHNYPRATIFLGDAGALLIGFLLAALGLQTQVGAGQGTLWLAVPLLAMAVPLVDTAFVIIARIRGHRPIYVGGTDHTSHQLVRLGLTTKATALVLYAMQFAASAVAAWLVFDGSPAPLVAAPAVLGVCAYGLWSLVIAPARERTAVHELMPLDAGVPDVIQLDVVDLDVVDLRASFGPAPASVASPMLYEGKKGV